MLFGVLEGRIPFQLLFFFSFRLHYSNSRRSTLTSLYWTIEPSQLWCSCVFLSVKNEDLFFIRTHLPSQASFKTFILPFYFHIFGFSSVCFINILYGAFLFWNIIQLQHPCLLYLISTFYYIFHVFWLCSLYFTFSHTLHIVLDVCNASDSQTFIWFVSIWRQLNCRLPVVEEKKQQIRR